MPKAGRFFVSFAKLDVWFSDIHCTICFCRKLAVKEAQERHLTEEWTEKWKEAANILKEQQALALKRTGQGVMLDSEKPHLVNISPQNLKNHLK